jgi:hypothetical protein
VFEVQRLLQIKNTFWKKNNHEDATPEAYE